MRRYKGVVRRRLPEDDEGATPEDIWPAEMQWILDENWFDMPDDEWSGGCTSPFLTHAEALAEAVRQADDVTRRNADWLARESTDL